MSALGNNKKETGDCVCLMILSAVPFLEECVIRILLILKLLESLYSFVSEILFVMDVVIF